jgi:PAS domain S-box-containing protein
LFREYDRKALAVGSISKNEEQITDADDGHRIFLETIKTPMFDSNGNLVGVLGIGRDITERKQAEKALKEASVRVSLATKAGGVGVWEYDFIHNRLEWDEQMFALYGISRETFGGANESWRACVHPGDLARADEEVKMALCGEKDFDTEFRVVWPDGTVRHIQALAMILRDADGKPLHTIGTNWDITKRKMAEEALKDANADLAQKDALLRSMLHNMPFDFWARDLHQNMLIQSKESVRMWGDFTGTTVHEADVAPEYLAVWKATNARVLAGEVVSSEQAYTILGEPRQFHAIVAPTLLAEEVQGILGINIDITERKRAEEALREQRDFSESLIETAQVIILVLDTQGALSDSTPTWSNWSAMHLDEVKGRTGSRRF